MQTPLSPSQLQAPWSEVKKDWVYQRKKTLIFKSWQPRFMVLYRAPVPAVALYEQRSDSVPPYAPVLHMEINSAVKVDRWKFSNNSSDGAKGSNSYAASTVDFPLDDSAPRSPISATSSLRRGSMTSLVSEQLRFQQRSKKQNEENALVLYKADSKVFLLESFPCLFALILFFNNAVVGHCHEFTPRT